MEYYPIARIYNDFPTKFGLPRQSGMAEHLISRIFMEEPYRNIDAFRGIESFNYLWLLWVFEPMGRREWSPTVRPPKLGGNKRMGVFATRSPNRPNPIGLTRVKFVSIEKTETGDIVLTVAGADLKSGTEILDIKPYLPFADSVTDAYSKIYSPEKQETFEVKIPEEAASLFGDEQLLALKEVLSNDPRPGYQTDSNRVYGFVYGGYDIHFTVADKTVTVIDAVKKE
ncbi:MAG: tRNA (N6-threonylcarbamoyladenosine(37)-N6)-methyltransferase TrmO [Clostridia bacterium]|nr:tRNA (N6-threonylcarbamoyladenosine(37)-N6)-methyltransferase TrmO [Clostridia bacterium]